MTKPLSDLDLGQLNKADQLMDEGDYAEEIEILGTLLVMHQAEPRIHALRGYASYRLEDYSKAIQDFDIAISAVPNAVNTLFLRGRSLEELGDLTMPSKTTGVSLRSTLKRRTPTRNWVIALKCWEGWKRQNRRTRRR